MLDFYSWSQNQIYLFRFRDSSKTHKRLKNSYPYSLSFESDDSSILQALVGIETILQSFDS